MTIINHHFRRSSKFVSVRLATASLATVALLAACGGGGGDGSSDSAASGDGEGEPSLQSLLFDEDDFKAREAKVQEEIRKCMQTQGWEYTPIDPDRFGVRMAMRGGLGDDEEFRRTKGYGISTTFGEGPGGEAAGSGDGDEDPNQEYRESLSESEKEAYDVALYGRSLGEGGEGGVAIRIGPGGGAGEVDGGEGDLADAGCFGQAQTKVRESSGRDPMELGPKMKELFDRIESDPRMVKANTDWSRCMTGEGYEYDTPDDIVEYLFERMNELQGTEGDSGSITIGPETKIDEAALSRLQAEELALAKADLACSEETGRAGTEKEVRQEAEAQFIEDNPQLFSDSDEG